MKKITERIDAHTHIPKEKLKLFPHYPDAVKIEVTSRCNLKCNFCAVSKGLRPVGDMNWDFFCRIIKELKELGVKEIGLFLLGESFVLPNLEDYVKYVKDLGFPYVFITTNGVASTPKKIEAVIKAGLDALKFSINAGSKETYKILQGGDFYEIAINNVKWLYEYKKNNNIQMKTALSSILIPEYKEEFEKFHKDMAQYVDETYFLPLYNLAGHMAGEGKREKVKGNIGRIANPSRPIPCWVLFNASKITWDGWLTACYSDHDERFKLGNLKNKTVLECWHSKKATDLRKQHLENNFRYDSLCARCLGKENV